MCVCGEGVFGVPVVCLFLVGFLSLVLLCAGFESSSNGKKKIAPWE